MKMGNISTSEISNIKRQLKRSKVMLKSLDEIKSPSIWWYERVGYYKGVIRIREDLLDYLEGK